MELTPITRKENFLAKAAGDPNALDLDPITREEWFISQIQGGGGGGGAVSSVNGKTGAVVLDADDVGAEPEKLIVTVTESGGSFTADKTLAEVTEASNSGKLIYFKYGPLIALAEVAYSGAFRATFVTLGDDGTGTNVMTFFYNALGIYVGDDGPMASNITATLDPTNFTFVFNYEKHIELVKEGKPFVLSYQSRYLLCQLNGLISGTDYNARLIDNGTTYVGVVYFANDGTARVKTRDADITDLSDLAKTSVPLYDTSVAVASPDKYFGFDYDGIPGYYFPPQFEAERITDQSVVSIVTSIITELKSAALQSADKKASFYTYPGDMATNLVDVTRNLLDFRRQVWFLIDKYLLTFETLILSSDYDSGAAAKFNCLDVDLPNTLSDPAVTYNIHLTATISGLLIIEVKANSVPPIPD